MHEKCYHRDGRLHLREVTSVNDKERGLGRSRKGKIKDRGHSNIFMGAPRPISACEGSGKWCEGNDEIRASRFVSWASEGKWALSSKKERELAKKMCVSDE